MAQYTSNHPSSPVRCGAKDRWRSTLWISFPTGWLIRERRGAPPRSAPPPRGGGDAGPRPVRREEHGRCPGTIDWRSLGRAAHTHGRDRGTGCAAPACAPTGNSATRARLDEFLPHQLWIVAEGTTMALTGDGELGFDSGEGA